MGLLRLLLALSVLTAHMKGGNIFGFRLIYGNEAVECFFMISGFYMALVLNEKYNQRGDYFPFLWQRVLRLYPVYLVVFLTTLVTLGVVSFAAGQPQSFFIPWFQYAHNFSPLTWAYLIIANLFIVGIQLVRFIRLDPTTGDLGFTNSPDAVGALAFSFIPQAWTLDLELMFYLIAPFLVRRHVLVQIFVFVGSIVLRLSTAQMLTPDKSPWFSNSFFPYELAFFMAGSVAYQVYRHQQPFLLRLRGFFSWFQWVFFFIVIAYSRLPGLAHPKFFVFSLLLFLMIPLLFLFTKDNARDRMIGELSYPFYLIHFLVLILMFPWVHSLPKIMQGPLYAAVALGTAYLLYSLFERQIDIYRHRLFDKQRRSPSVSLATKTKVID